MVMAMDNTLEALKACRDAMLRSVSEGCTDHLDWCDDGGTFWRDAIAKANAALDAADDAEEEG